MIRTAVGFIRWYLKRTGFAGITLPPWGVYILAERLTDERLVRHEQVHWEQYKRMGALKFYAVYIGYTLRYGYRNNPMEIEARAGETHVA